MEALEVEDGEQTFDAKELGGIIVGNKVFCNNECDDIEYEYVLDFRKRVLRADSLGRVACMITFNMLWDGYLCSDFDDYLND